jgi:hypothetical protein
MSSSCEPACCRQDIVIPIPALQPGLIKTPLNVAFKDQSTRNITFFFSGKVNVVIVTTSCYCLISPSSLG